MRPVTEAAVRLWSRAPSPTRAAQVLGYHRVDDADDPLCVDVGRFIDQMALLDEGRTRRPVVALDDLPAYLASSGTGRAAVLTFDDAWADNHTHALPALIRYALPATLYVPSRLLGSPGYASRGQVAEMVASGVSLGAHSRTHCDLRRCTLSELESEVRGSRDDLEDWFNIPVRTFAYPAGHYTPLVVQAVAAAGFLHAVSTRRGWVTSHTDPLLLRRNFVERIESGTFSAMLDGGANVLAGVERARELTGRLFPTGGPQREQ